MANVYATKSGNWSDITVWNTGALPTSSDDVFSNNFTVQVDGVFTVLSVRNTAAAPIVANGTFVLNHLSNLKCLDTQGIYVGVAGKAVVQFAGGSGTNAILEATLPATLPNISSYVGVLHSGTGTLNIIGDISFNAGVTGRIYVSSTSTGILNIIGNVSTTTGGGVANNSCINMAGGYLFVNGNVLGGGISSGHMIVGGTSVIEITGDVIASNVAHISQGSSITVIGSITNTGTGVAINAVTATVQVTGAITVNNTGAGIISTTGGVTVGGPISVLGPNGANNAVSSTSGLVKVSGLLFNYNQWQAVFAPKITIEPTTTSITYQTFASGNQIMYVGSSGALGQPTTNDVRFGTVYGAASEFTGTLRVPTAATVLLGTLVDATTGTYLPSSPADFVTELNTSTTPVAVRLQNCSTVNTTGDQIASYNV